MILKTAQLMLVTLALSGCTIAGTAIRSGRVHYNRAIQETNNEQLLLNLVRLRYLDVPYFIEVAGISATFEVSAQASGLWTEPRSPDSAREVRAQLGAREQPTITYAPLAGDKFASQLMTPLDENTILLLYQSGWPIKRVLLTTVQNMNGLENAPFGLAPATARQYQPFREAVELLSALQDRGALSLGMVVESKEKSHLELRIADDVGQSPEAKRLRELLQLDPQHNRFPITAEAGPSGPDHIDIVPGSLMSCLFYLSHAVETPTRDEDAGLVTVTRAQDGQRFDWRTIMGDLIQVHQSSSHPSDPYVAVRYRDRWFYIRNDDTDSKATFVMISQLFALRAGDVRSAMPLLTLPVTR